eukprot:CAMPEP_0175893756 /NCGR_PEP_ID=MMETSP0107_2-20121207/49633_1 /TAXON_ID=195067 ORGANISM="Goniomonas pacifica, Strain CCMP1869" /NCGR_SAMPLE_ID=MMETSP0107_2 /ASSEMBLY_ACC=CAM_ASM_000203 /LENGTH=47 /DNA_ID= /DNA_START= /DNA_END= /DNA_ORIENTATION=
MTIKKRPMWFSFSMPWPSSSSASEPPEAAAEAAAEAAPEAAPLASST